MKRKRFKRKTKISTRALAKKALNLAKVNQPPIKHHDLHVSTAPTSTGTVHILSNVAEGDGEHERSGEETRLLSLRWRGMVFRNAAAEATTNHMIRLIIFRDMSDEGSNPVVSGTPDGIIESANVNSQYLQDNKKRYIILSDKVYTITPSESEQYFQGYLNLRKVKASYNNTTANDNTRGHLWLMYITNSSTLAPTVSIRTRCYFYSA